MKFKVGDIVYVHWTRHRQGTVVLSEKRQIRKNSIVYYSVLLDEENQALMFSEY